MAMSVKSLMNCLDVDTSGARSLNFWLFGFIRGRVPPEADTSLTAEVSLLQLMKDCQGKHIHLNVIQVGFDALSDADEADALENLDYAVYRIRNIYRPRSLGVGRVEHYFITDAEANGREVIGSEDEANALWDEWSVHNDALDCFVVRDIVGFLGLSPVEGTCDKDDKDDGLLAGDITRPLEGLSRTFAHECGHYLGLEHNHGGDDCPSGAGRDRLMAQTGCANSLRNSVVLTSSEGVDMRDHCFVKNGC